ncbi:carboxypeptidase-like regulatory domain-containing protein [Chitinophaga pinensis]|nr:carboxypeptidase-like regulatory domain-containing protein [Chitinophaga pinensis]
MKKKNPFTLHIPQPCAENWNQMTPNEKGRFCQHCQKTVIDFSNMSDHEVANIVNRSKEQICGRLHVSQLNREIYTAEKNAPWMKIAAMLSALTLTAPAVSAKHTAVEKIQVNNREEDNIRLPCDSIPVITGRVTDSTNFPIPAANIIIEKTSHGVISDNDGKFRLSAFTEAKDTTIVIRITSLGYLPKEIPISLHAIPKDLVVILEPAYLSDEQGVIAGGISTCRPLNAWRRLKYKIGSLFH